MIDDRFIETGSGMEQLIFSFAFRMRLAKYQYADLFVVDESFSPLDAENQIKAGMICKTIPEYFTHVFIVSHIESLKDFVDNTIEIKK
jgi:DNA repair exonuclease SbcCD ATPase subunit